MPARIPEQLPTSQPISRACAAEFSQRCTEPSSNRPEFLTWYAISAVSWRDAQSLARERGDGRSSGLEEARGEGAHGNPGQVIVSRNSVQRPQVAASVSYTSSIKDLIESLSFSVFFSAIISLPHLRARVHVLERNVGGSSVETPMSSSSSFSLPPFPPNLITHRFRILV